MSKSVKKNIGKIIVGRDYIENVGNVEIHNDQPDQPRQVENDNQDLKKLINTIIDEIHKNEIQGKDVEQKVTEIKAQIQKPQVDESLLNKLNDLLRIVSMAVGVGTVANNVIPLIRQLISVVQRHIR